MHSSQVYSLAASHSSCLANVEGSIDKVVLHNSIQHADVVSGEGLSAEVLMVAEGWTVVVPDVVMNYNSSHFDHVPKLMHLINTLAAQEPNGQEGEEDDN